jgi:ankyrin repeat protein
MKPNTKSLTFEELYNQIFNDGIITKQNKDKLYKSAKAINDIKTIERMAHELDFKNAIKYVEINSKKVIQELFISMDTDSIIKAIENGLDVNSKNDKDSNFLHFAVEQDNRALIKFLIDKNININCQDKDGATALLLASQENNYESIKILIEANADVNLKSKHGYTPLMVSVAKFNSIDAAHLLIKSGAEINVQDIRGVSPLMLAAQQNFGSMVLLLLENGANTNLTSIEGYNSLHLPCS